MCGIFGFSYRKKQPLQSVRQTLRSLFLLSESRGKDASGFAFLAQNEAYVFRAPQKASAFVRSEEFTALLNKTTDVVIGNTRLATNGIAKNPKNNQPVITKDSIGIHNGMIVNESKLWKKFPSLKREYDIDTEVLLKLTELFVSKGYSIEKAVSAVYREIKGAASVAIMNRFSPVVVLATNTGSLYYVSDENIFLFASEAYIVQMVLGQSYFVKQLKPGFGLSFDYQSFEVNNFVLGETLGQSEKKPSAQSFFDIYLHEAKRSTFSVAADTQQNTLSYLKQHSPDYDAIKKLKRCARCILPETMPMISFDNNGVCNFCKTSKPISYRGLHALKEAIQQYEKMLKGGKCIVAFSGGRDSSFGLHYVKNVLKMDPIAYTYDWGMVTDIARRNQYRLTAEMGVEHIIVSADIEKKRENIKKNVEAWLRKPNIAMVPLFMAGDKQAEYYAEEVKRKTGIRLMIYCRGNEFEDERFKFGYYGIFDGTPAGVLHNLSLGGKARMALYYAREYLLNLSYFNTSFSDTLFAYFSSYLMNHKDFIYLWHYIPWDEKEIITTLKERYGWESPDDTIATWRIDDGTPPFYNYIYYTLQGFTEHDCLRSNQIRQGVLTRKEALALANEENKPRYEALKWYFDVTKIDGDKALTIIDRMKPFYKSQSAKRRLYNNIQK